MTINDLLTSETFWLSIGFGGQIFFTSRFLVQWIASERAGKSVMPVSFWFLSIGGSLMLLTYALHRRDPVFILGQSCGSIIYIRNLHLIYKERLALAEKKDRASSDTPDRSKPECCNSSHANCDNAPADNDNLNKDSQTEND